MCQSERNACDLSNRCGPIDKCMHHRNRCAMLSYALPNNPKACCIRQTSLERRLCQQRCNAQPLQQAEPIGSNSLFVFGLGYTTLGLANRLGQHGWRVTATLRDPKAAERLVKLKAKLGWKCVLFDPCSAPGQLSSELLGSLAEATHVVSGIPPVGLPLYDPVLSAQLKAIKSVAKSGRLQWLGYLSSTGVYGDYGGDWVDEESEARSLSSRGYVRRQAEEAWVEVARTHHLPLRVFRLGGIYGPGRSLLSSGPAAGTPPVTTQQHGTPTALQPRAASSSSSVGPGAVRAGSASKARRGQQKYISRVHVYDICQALIASMQQSADPTHSTQPPGVDTGISVNGAASSQQAHLEPGGNASGSSHSVAADSSAHIKLYNLVDDEPASRAEVMEYVWRLQQLGNQHQGQSQPLQQPQQEPQDVAMAAAQQDLAHADLASSSMPSGSQAQPEIGLEQPSLPAGSSSGSAGSGTGRSRGDVLEEKRVRNVRMKSELDVTLRYPTYREGMAALVAGELEPFTDEDLRWLGLTCS